ncbi:MAG: glycosyltransferase [Oscillospiraceae bacterium]|nr:glycosyltransferase [Oscillospiraceae bacterium]
MHELLFELMSSGDELLEFLGGSLNQIETDTGTTVSESMGELYKNIAVYVENNKIDKQHRGREAALNAELAALKLRDYFKNKDQINAEHLLTYELIPLHIFLANELNFWYAIYPDTEKMHEYAKMQLEDLREYVPHHEEALAMEYRYDVSIAVLCYNKAYLTKTALNSLLKYTDFDKYSVEIIVINNGSDDNGETSAYINSLDDPRIKTVELKYPLGYNGYSLGPLAACGRYFVEFHTDVIATSNWLNNLMECICSDSRIGAVATVSNDSANNQEIAVDYADPMENDADMQIFALKHNITDPSKWEERARMLPTSSYITPTALYRRLLRDPWLYYGQFTDDDMALFLRRCGFRQVVATDTFLHHSGSQTSSFDIEKNDSVRKMRERFFTKWGVDAWVSSRFNPGVNHFIRELTEIGNSESFLFIDPYFGSTALFTFNYYRANNKTIGETAAIINDMRYIEDAVYYDKTIVGDVTESLLKLGSKFDYIFFNPDIEDYIDENFPKLLKTLHKVCKPKAKVVFTLSNPGYYLGIKDLLNGDITGDNSKKPYQPWLGIRFIDPEYVFKAAREQGFLCKVSGIDCPKIEKYTQIIKQLQPLVQDKSKAKALDYIFFLFELSPIDLL